MVGGSFFNRKSEYTTLYLSLIKRMYENKMKFIFNTTTKMPKHCVAYGCTNHNLQKDKTSFHRFPAAAERRKRWIVACKRINSDGTTWVPSKHAVLCGKHFISGKPNSDPGHPDYIPSVFVYSSKDGNQDKLARFARCTSTKRRKLEDEFTCTSDSDSQGDANDNNANTSEFHSSDKSAQEEPDSEKLITDFQEDEQEPLCTQKPDSDFTEERKLYFHEIGLLRKERDELREELKKHKINAETFSQEKIKFYTGLPNSDVFKLILKLCESQIDKSRTRLTLSDELLMVLMKLRLNLSNEDLSFRFDVSKSSVSVIFHKWLDILSVRMKPFIPWVPKETIMATLPLSFKTDYKFCRGIFDCSEIYIEQPVKRKARAQTWSNYKRHNTVKFFINVTPRGLISFISKGYGGRISDKEITMNCGILDLVDPTDLYLADRGFQREVQEAFALKGAKVITPSFACGAKQMSAKDVERSRKISNVRIHVERVIGLLKNKYQILKGPIPITTIVKSTDNEIATIDKILIVCAALCNLSDGIVM